MYEDKPITEPIKVKRLGTILHKAGVFIPNSEGSTSGTTPPHDIIEGYVLEKSYSMLQEREQALRKNNLNLMEQVQNLRNKTNDDDVEETKEYLDLIVDVKRIDTALRRIDKRMRKTKLDDVAVKCANAIGLLEGKKLLLIQAVIHKK